MNEDDLNLEDEALKLYCLIRCCVSNVKQNGEDFLSRKYLEEKSARLITGLPIILDSKAQFLFEMMKQRRDEWRFSESENE